MDGTHRSTGRVPAALAAAGLTAAALALGAGAIPAAGALSSTAEATYIVVLDPSTTSAVATATRHEQRFGAEVEAVYSHALAGYAAELTAGEAARLRTDDSVAYVEREQVLELAQSVPQVVPTNIERVGADRNPRIDIDSRDDVRIDADVAIFDSGILPKHPDLNVASSVTCSHPSGCVAGSGDVRGHGTLVAGIVGALDNGFGTVGVAPGARLHSVGVCNAEGACFPSQILAGIDHVTARGDIEVVNMSLGGPNFPDQAAISQAITASVARGVVYVAAAGNSHADAATTFPANHPDVIAVSGVADSDGLPGGFGADLLCMGGNDDDHLDVASNYGATVDVAAPGRCITSTSRDGGYGNATGTSMAAPHVAGAAALLTSGSRSPGNRAQVLAVRQKIVATGSYDWTDCVCDSVKEPLLDVHDATRFPGPGTPTTVFSDTFETNRGWTTNLQSADTATRGRWERGDPEPTSLGGVALQLGSCTSGTNCLVTGRLAGADARADDVDGGRTSITSPLIALPPDGIVNLTARWYVAHLDDTTGADEIRVRVVPAGGAPLVTVLRQPVTLPWAGRWSALSIDLGSYAGTSVRLVFDVGDAAADSLVEAGFDDVTVTHSSLRPSG